MKIPSMGESISEVTIGQIFKPSGSDVETDEEILELETDKVNQALYSPGRGKVLLEVRTGDRVKIGQPIGYLDADESKPETPSTKKKQELLQPEENSISPVLPSSSNLTDSSPVPPEPIVSDKEGLRYTKKAFLEDLASDSKEETSIPVSGKIDRVVSDRGETRRPMSKIRRVIGKRLVEALQTTAMLTTFNEVDLTEVIRLREKYKEAFAKKYACKLGFMSFFVKAVVSALQTFEDVNSFIDGDEIVRRNYYDIGVAVGTDKGVIVPIVRDADRLGFAEIEQEIERFAKKAREGKIVIQDLQGGGFTVTNGGTYGSLLSTPILIPPQCAILGMHKIEKRPVVIDDEIKIRSMMYLALSYDHRLIDGKEAVSFLVHIKNVLEDPSRLVIEI